MTKVGTFLAGPVGSWLRVFVFVVLGLWLQDLEQIEATGWLAYVIAGALAVGPIVLAWLNPQDPRFGKTED